MPQDMNGVLILAPIGYRGLFVRGLFGVVSVEFVGSGIGVTVTGRSGLEISDLDIEAMNSSSNAFAHSGLKRSRRGHARRVRSNVRSELEVTCTLKTVGPIR